MSDFIKPRKAVFPVAGLGTRFLPATKVSPKEMLPVVDKPLIQYATEEAISAGIETLIFVNGRNKRAIEDHFDDMPELVNELHSRGKDDLLEQIENIVPTGVTCVSIRQSSARGLGDAVLCAEPVIGDEPFVVLLADDLVVTQQGDNVTQRLLKCYRRYRTSMLSVEHIEPYQSRQYGVISGDGVESDIWKVNRLVEKPEPEDAPSRIGLLGRYVLTPSVFDCLKKVGSGVGREVQLTDAIAMLMESEVVHAQLCNGKRYDCGSKLGYVQANVECALQHDQIGEEFSEYLRKFNDHL